MNNLGLPLLDTFNLGLSLIFEQLCAHPLVASVCVHRGVGMREL